MLASCRISPRQAVLMHFNLGGMLPIEGCFDTLAHSAVPHYAQRAWGPYVSWANSSRAAAAVAATRLPRMQQAAPHRPSKQQPRRGLGPSPRAL